MTKRSLGLVGAGILLFVTLALGAYYKGTQALTEARVVACIMNLDDIGSKINKFHEANGRYPKNVGELDLQPGTLADTVSGRKFVWTQQLPDGKARVRLVWQPLPYRTCPWPFGRMQQMALYSDFAVTDMLSENEKP